MQSSGIKSLYCKCEKETSKTMCFGNNKEISIHFGKKKTYWHIYENFTIKRVFKQPKEWE